MRDLLELTKKLITFRTMHTRPDEIRRCADFIESFLRSVPVGVRRMERDGIPSLWVLPEADRVPVLLMSHIDVVAAPESLFEPVERDGCLYGRGSIDDKYAVALSLLLLARHVKEQAARGQGLERLPFGILITGDEEIGGYRGAREALPGIPADFAIALDGGSLHEIIVKEKGILRLRLIAQGRTAHGARPWLGRNAIEILMDDLNAVKALFAEHTEDHWHRTLNIGLIQGGVSVNQVPDRAEAHLDIRYTENDDPDDLVDAIRRAVRSHVDVVECEPLFLGETSGPVQILLNLVPGARLGRAHGASDARFLSQFGIPGVVWGADGEESQHAENEHVTIDSMVRLYETLDQFVRILGNS
ncbi:MAG: M20/M25/M40 family metallo-hydrolase [Desulfosoma sp.]